MQEKKYLCVRQKGIVRLTTATPAHIEGVFFEHLITCVGLCFRSPDNNRMSFIHMDASMDLQAIDDEIAWINHPEWQLITFINNQAATAVQAKHHLPP